MRALPDHRQKFDRLRDDCPVKAAIDVIRGRWKPSILWELDQGTRRFTALRAALPAVAAQTLTLQLRQLEADGVVRRTVYPEIPARVEYELSEFGRTLAQVMGALDAWGQAYLARQPRPPT